MAPIIGSDRVRLWLYYRARKDTGTAIADQLILDRRKVTVIGDAARAGKAVDATRDAFEVARFVEPATGASRELDRLQPLDDRRARCIGASQSFERRRLCGRRRVDSEAKA